MLCYYKGVGFGRRCLLEVTVCVICPNCEQPIKIESVSLGKDLMFIFDTTVFVVYCEGCGRKSSIKIFVEEVTEDEENNF